MAEYTAVYEAAAAVVELLRREMTPEPVSKPEMIGLCAPFEPEDFQVTVHLYHLEEEGHRAESAYGYRQEGLNGQRFAPLPLNLHLMITAHSKAPVITRAADEQRILGRAIQVVRDHPDLTPYLAKTAAQAQETLRLTLEKAQSADQLMRVWSGANKPYKLSFGCQVSTVLIDSERTRTVARVRSVRITTEDTSK